MMRGELFSIVEFIILDSKITAPFIQNKMKEYETLMNDFAALQVLFASETSSLNS